MEDKKVIVDESNEFQCTVRNIVYLKSVGLHSGKDVSIIIKPAQADEGITFVRKDMTPAVIIKANSQNICSTNLRTSVGKNGVCVSTIEHLMSALWGAGIDNALIEVYGEEIPALDGSAKIYYEAIFESGIKELNTKRKYLKILEPVIVSSSDNIKNNSCEENDYSIAIYPSDDFEISYSMNFNHPFVGSGLFELKIDASNFYNEISKARTFGFLKEVELLKKNGLALGGSLDNALVLNETGVLNKEGLRYKDEFIRHKVLDLIGDLYISGYRIKGKVVAKKTGHDMNAKLVKAINENKREIKSNQRMHAYGKTFQLNNFLHRTDAVIDSNSANVKSAGANKFKIKNICENVMV
ncbi:MAG: UDP-3-O-acyl-N-acetylglucosamine deacetylase [bacterium]